MVFVKEGETAASLTLGKGHYQILSFSAYSGRMSELMNKNLYQDIFHVDWNGTRGDFIKGSIRAGQDEKVITSIPYDENFEVLIDDKPVETEIVNKTFLGFDIMEGEHQITIHYQAKGLIIGMIASLIGFFIFLLLFRRERVAYVKV